MVSSIIEKKTSKAALLEVGHPMIVSDKNYII